MAGPESQRVTPSGVRDGDPAALAALCAARSPAVLAYTRAVLPPEPAVRAAAEAFARFRAAVIALGDDPAVDPDRLLLGATRRATAALAPPPPPSRFGGRGACLQLPQLIAAKLEGELSAADEGRIARHLLRCASCRALAAGFDAAERAFAAPPPGRVPAEATVAIVGALATAGGPLAPTVEQITAEFQALPPEVALAPEPPVVAAEQAAAAERPASAPSPGDAEEPAVDDPAPAPPARRASRLRVPTRASLGTVPSRLGGLVHRRERPAAAAPLRPMELPPPPPADAITALMPPIGRAGEPGPPPPDEPAEPVTPLPPPPAFARPPRHRPHLPQGDVVRTVVLPLGVVAVAAVGAMAIAGVFGEDEPGPLPSTPVITAPAETIPGAGPEPATVRPGDGPPPGLPDEPFAGGLGVPGPGVDGP